MIKGAINYGSSDGAEELDSIILHGKAIGGRMNRDALRSECVQLKQCITLEIFLTLCMILSVWCRYSLRTARWLLAPPNMVDVMHVVSDEETD